MRTALIFALLLASAFSQETITASFRKTGGGATNNAAIVSGHLGGASAATGATVAFSFAGATVTSGNFIFCGVNDLSAPAYVAGFLTKTAGTSTIGTVVLDQSRATNASIALYRIPVTGTGTITLTYNPANGANYRNMGCAEFTGINATPLSTNSGLAGGSTALHTTGPITTTDVGVMIYVSSETPNADFTRTWSDTIIYHIDTGASTSTIIVQYKLINGTPNTLQDCTGATPTLPGGACNVGGDSEVWDIIYALYKST